MVDYSVWDKLLKEYVNIQGQVDYRRWQLEAEKELNQWLDSISSLEQQQLASEEQLTLLINLYNALVIAQILKRYPLKSILPRFLGIPNWISFLRFFTQPIYTLDDQPLSLNDIEHKLLRQQWQEPRIHFALVCAARGCPLLRNEAYSPIRIQEQLTDDATRFINNVDKVSYFPEHNLLQYSKIFKWYKKDFLQVSPSILTYINQYLSVTVPESASVQYLPYDWHLNEQSMISYS
jgi:hypothetical protein